MTDGSTRGAAAGRIRAASAVAWVVGAIVIAVLSFNALADLRLTDGGIFPGYDGDEGAFDRAWTRPDPPEATLDADGTIHAPRGGSMLRVSTDDYPAGSILALQTITDDRARIYVTRTEDLDRAAGADFEPDSYGSVYPDETLPIMRTGEIELWILVDIPWTGRLTTIETQPLETSVSGKGDAWLLYEGDAITAHAVHRGEGIFFVTVTTATDREMPIIETGEVDRRFAWTDGPGPVLIGIESSADRGAWEITIEGGSAATPTDPTPEPTDNPEE